jgi:hypothetical protein
MGTKFKEVNTLSFIGHIGPKTERVWKEVDEEIDIVGCKEKFERPCQLIAPLDILKKDLPGDGDRRQVPIFVNDDVRIELMYCRASEGIDGRRPAGFYETQIQVQNKRVTKTPEGDFDLARRCPRRTAKYQPRTYRRRPDYKADRLHSQSGSNRPRLSS